VRTTLTLDDDVAVLVKEEMRKSGKSMKETVNYLIKRGITAPRESKPFVVKPIAMGLPPGLSYDKMSELLDYLDELDSK
jgi:hypothetical protein